jgi:DNA-binding response OmpR family regulator
MNSPTDILTDKTAAPADINGAEAAVPRPRERRLQSAGEIRILILDDDVGVCDIIKRALADTDFIVDVISDPTKAEVQLREKAASPYHLIILDYVLPGVPSDSIFSWVAEYQKEASIIVVTGYPSIDSALNCLRARTYDYLTKPFDVNQLSDVVSRCLESKGLLRMSEDALRENLGLVIREKRKALGLTLADLAKRTEVSLGYLSQIELGKNSASIETLYRISLGLSIKLADLFLAVQQRT